MNAFPAAQPGLPEGSPKRQSRYGDGMLSIFCPIEISSPRRRLYEPEADRAKKEFTLCSPCLCG